ncbi:UDP-3-O-acyl-N-acetylglucosamine deacetylase [Nitrospira sp. Kam-Ns4a]
MRQQQTVARAVSCTGVGLHSGQSVTLRLRPAPPDTGIVFIRRHDGKTVAVRATVANLAPTELCTAIRLNGTEIKTIEHVLAALAGLEIDNVYVEVDAGEVPAMDGSAAPFVELIRTAGIAVQGRPQPYLKILQPIEVVDGARRVVIEPSVSTRITYTIRYNHPLIQTQTYRCNISAASFAEEIASARTFGFLHEVEMLWSKGLGLGGSLDNTIVLSENGILNRSGLRFADEFVRHKVLDLIGDLALLGMPFIGHLIADRSGHALHTRLVEQVLTQGDKWMLVTSEEEARAAAALEACPTFVPAQAPPLQATTAC